MEIGRVCVKTAGRDAGNKCVVIEQLDDNFVMIDGATRRRKCNPKHLEPLDQTLDIKEGASHSKVKEAFNELDVEVRETTPKESSPRPKKQKVEKEEPTQTEESEESQEDEEKEIPARSTIENKTKDEIKEYASEEWDVELSTNDLKDEMIDQLFEEIS